LTPYAPYARPASGLFFEHTKAFLHRHDFCRRRLWVIQTKFQGFQIHATDRVALFDLGPDENELIFRTTDRKGLLQFERTQLTGGMHLSSYKKSF